jgi:hypothetical protein
MIPVSKTKNFKDFATIFPERGSETETGKRSGALPRVCTE